MKSWEDKETSIAEDAADYASRLMWWAGRCDLFLGLDMADRKGRITFEINTNPEGCYTVRYKPIDSDESTLLFRFKSKAEFGQWVEHPEWPEGFQP